MPAIPLHQPNPHRARTRRLLPVVAATLSLLVAGSGCSNDDADANGTNGDALVSGPLCQALPSGSEPGNPASLVNEPADVALQWIPVLYRFESAVRAAEMDGELRAAKGVTILAPTDDAFAAKFSDDTIDELFISRVDDLRRLLRSHLVEGTMSVSELVDAGSVTTLAGSSLKISRAGEMARIDDGDDTAETVCADYRVGNARIHVIDKVLGDLPTDPLETRHQSH